MCSSSSEEGLGWISPPRDGLDRMLKIKVEKKRSRGSSNLYNANSPTTSIIYEVRPLQEKNRAHPLEEEGGG